MQDKVTIYDVATKAGVSPSTVSRVINNSPKVAENTRLCVRRAMRELGYVPDRTAQALATGREERSGKEGKSRKARSSAAQTEKNKLLCFEGDWETKERDAVQRAIFRSQIEAAPWLCVKTYLQGAKTFIALRLNGSRKMVTAHSARDLATRILSHEGVSLRPSSSVTMG